ncbi:MAG: SPFH domain-containing protein [Clostridia bacterium]|nr:SPFH domain-containing protein [Clostridia bacterium]
MTQPISVIQHNNDSSTFIWKHPCEDFSSSTTLVVQENQEAVLFMNGQAFDSFGPGAYALETKNIPLLAKWLNISGDATPFHCELYFINKAETITMKWGTPSRIQYEDPTHGFLISLGAFGELHIKIEDSYKLLSKLKVVQSYLDPQVFKRHFHGILCSQIKSYITQAINSSSINIFNIDESLVSITEATKELLIPKFASHGIAVEKFLIISINVPDDDKTYEKMKELHFRQLADIAEVTHRQQMEAIRLEAESKHSIFISYRRDGGDTTAKLICETLKNKGYTVFFDYDSLKGGCFDNRLLDAIDKCSDVVLILPKNALARCKNENDWVRQEIRCALTKKKNIIPVMLDGFSFPKKLPPDIQDVSRYNGVRFRMDFFEAVIDKIIEKLSPNKKTSPTE